jgi:hypothetical protein
MGEFLEECSTRMDATQQIFSLNYRQDKGLQALKFFLSTKVGDDEGYYVIQCLPLKFQSIQSKPDA